MRSSFLKIAGAFVAGLILALASAIVYFKGPNPQASVSRATGGVAAATAPATPAVQEQPPAPAETQTPAPPAKAILPIALPAARPAPHDHSRRMAAGVERTRLKAEEPVLLTAQNSPLPVAPVEPATYPALSQPPVDQRALSQPQAEVTPAAPEQTRAEQAPPAADPHRVELAPGTTVVIRLGQNLSSETHRAGEIFHGTLEQSIIRDGFIIAEKGSGAVGRIIDSTQAGRVRGVAALNLTLTEIQTTDGQRVRLETNAVEKLGTTSTGSDAAKVAGGAALGAIIGALGGGGKGAAIGAGAGGAAGTGVILATRGKPAVLPSESLLTFQISSPVTITEKLNR